jgi:hypothetical protein
MDESSNYDMIQNQGNAAIGVKAIKRLFDIVRMQNKSSRADGAGVPRKSKKLFRLLATWNLPQSEMPHRHDLLSSTGSINRTRCDSRQKKQRKGIIL